MVNIFGSLEISNLFTALRYFRRSSRVRLVPSSAPAPWSQGTDALGAFFCGAPTSWHLRWPWKVQVYCCWAVLFQDTYPGYIIWIFCSLRIPFFDVLLSQNNGAKWKSKQILRQQNLKYQKSYHINLGHSWERPYSESHVKDDCSKLRLSDPLTRAFLLCVFSKLNAKRTLAMKKLKAVLVQKLKLPELFLAISYQKST